MRHERYIYTICIIYNYIRNTINIFKAFQISNLIREYIEVLQKYGSSDENASRNLQSIYGPGIAALYQHQPPQRQIPDENMYMMHNTTTANELHHYQGTRPTSILHKQPPAPLIEDISV